LWLDKFKEVEEKLKEENEQIEKLVKKNLATPEQLKKLEDNKLELEGLKEYTYQYLGDVVKKENTLNLIIKTGDRGCEETVLKEFNKIKKEL
jgi:DNA polymerase III delta prime subunit